MNNEFCKKCGTPLVNKSLFCTICGEKIIHNKEINQKEASNQQAEKDQVVKEEETKEQIVENQAIKEEETKEQIVENQAAKDQAATTITQENIAINNDNITQQAKTKKISINKWIYIAVPAGLVFLLIAIFLTLPKTNNKTNHLFYLTGSLGQELKGVDMSKGKKFELTTKYNRFAYIDDDIYSSIFYNPVMISDNNKYIFYPETNDNDEKTYYYRNLTKNLSKEDSAVKIDSDITGYPLISKDGEYFFYTKGYEKRLYVYNRKKDEKIKIAEDVNSFFLSSDGSYLMFSEKVNSDSYDGNDYMLYEAKIKKGQAEKQKIDEASSYIFLTNEKLVYYIKDGQLYIKEHNKDKEKIASDVDEIVSYTANSQIYYLKSSETNISLEDFFIDDMLDADKNIVEPTYPDTSSEMPESPYYSDFYEKVWEADTFWGYDYNEETDEYGSWREVLNEEAYNKAYDDYEKAYDAWLDKKEKLIEDYYTDYDKYNEKRIRDDIRDYISDDYYDINYKEKELYYYAKGENTLIEANVDGYIEMFGQYDKPIAIFSKSLETIPSMDTVKMSEIIKEDAYAYEILSDLFSKLNKEDEHSQENTLSYYFAYEKDKNELDCKNPKNIMLLENSEIYYLNEYDENKKYGDLMKIKVSASKTSKAEKIDEEVQGYMVRGKQNSLIYYKDLYKDHADIYINKKKIGQDIYLDSIYSFDKSDTLLYYKDYNDRKEHGTLILNKKGKETKIADEVNQYYPINEKSIAFLADYNHSRYRGDLFLYTGRKPKLIEEDVVTILPVRGGLINFSFY